ncbi:MAG TPA: amidohydrolase family protein [Mycobacteriales bacterium]|nr:amidohydrolase family protein [Mycobacteriales bacterium]
MRVDAHHHVWDLAVRDQPFTADWPALRRSFHPDELRPNLLRHSVGGTVVVQTVTVAAETGELVRLARADPAVRGVVGWVEPTGPDIADRLADLVERGAPELVGIRHATQDEPDPRWLCRPDVRRGIAAIGAAALVYDVFVRPPQLTAAVETARALPDVRFVLNHMASPPIARGVLEPWQTMVGQLGALPNVAVKLSGLLAQAGPDRATGTLRRYVDVLLEAFGPRRVMFGSDWPVCLLTASYDEVVGAAEDVTAHLSAVERADVFGGTAARWYHLP